VDRQSAQAAKVDVVVRLVADLSLKRAPQPLHDILERHGSQAKLVLRELDAEVGNRSGLWHVARNKVGE
jgi:hypothetical protein